MKLGKTISGINLTEQKIDFLRTKVGPLLWYVPNVRPVEAFFISKMERCGLAQLLHKDIASYIAWIREDVGLLPTTLSEVIEAEICGSAYVNEFWVNRTLETIDEAKEALAPIMKFKRERPSLIFELGLDDVIAMRKWVVVRKDSQKMYIEKSKPSNRRSKSLLPSIRQ